MKQKDKKIQSIARRKPLQERSQQKVTLILEAAMQLLDKGDIESLTTNAIAERAGVSIGTLYQYFDSKQAVLNALSDREIDGLSERVLTIVRGTPGHSSLERLRLIFSAVTKTYGGRTRVHRLLLAHALSQGNAKRLNPLMATMTTELAQASRSGGAVGGAKQLTPSQAFVLTHTVTGVLRALLVNTHLPASRKDIEDALAELVEEYLAHR